MTKTPRQPACDPCRSSKLACDHKRPACNRCCDRDQASLCVYRAQPFKKLRRRGGTIAPPRSARQSNDSPSNSEDALSPEASPRLPRYPNAGYLGNSSHTTIFDHLPLQIDTHEYESVPDINSGLSEHRVRDDQISEGADLLSKVHQSIQITDCINFITAWVADGGNLSIAGIFIHPIASAVQSVFQDFDKSPSKYLAGARKLFSHTCLPLMDASVKNFESFCSRFCNQSPRWETVGLFFTAVSRATLARAMPRPLSTSMQQLHNLRKQAMNYSDHCLEMCLSLDCLNDLQLLLQYENFLLHTLIDGDQSLRSWRKLGDVSSSLFALGYHQDIKGNMPIPDFLMELKEQLFAVAYSADKNISIFLGRPPRIHRKNCQFRLKGLAIAGPHFPSLYPDEWSLETEPSYNWDTHWSALCAVFKEYILDLAGELSEDDKLTQARFSSTLLRPNSLIRSQIESFWSALPPHLRIDRKLKSYDRNPVQLDFLISAKLNYLHVLFMLHLNLVGRFLEPDEALLTVTTELLNLIIETALMKDSIVDSGISLSWKISYYGLSSAGVLCLALLNPSQPIETCGLSRSRVIQHLGILVAEIELGTLVRTDDANYGLLAEAAKTIRSILDKLLSSHVDDGLLRPVQSNQASLPSMLPDVQEWTPWGNNNMQDFEVNFWTTLAGHPLLT